MVRMAVPRLESTPDMPILPSMAVRLAKKAEPKQMWLTHFSPSLVGAERYMEQVRKIFPASYLGKDGKSIELDFEEDE